MIVLIAFISLLLLPSRTSSFSPVIPPRFDDFSDELVGTWSTRTQSQPIAQVEEVMRSCGGAIQGIKEIQLDAAVEGEEEEKSTYFNRADDGFVYYSDGSYIQGCVQMKNDGDDEKTVGCISFSTIPRSRVVFDSSSMSWKGQIRKKIEAINEDEHNRENQDDDVPRPNIEWGRYTLCGGMTNPTWMLQRAKWEQAVINSNSILDERVSISNLDEFQFQGWINKLYLERNDKDLFRDNIKELLNSTSNCNHKQLQGLEKLEALLLNDTKQIIQCGAVCKTTKEAKALLRCYDKQGMLKVVILQEGSIVDQ